MIKNIAQGIGIFLGIGALGLLAGATVAFANPSYFATGVSTNNAASTTPTYMTPGTATSTTPVYNAYIGKVSSQYAANSAGLLQRLCASSTATTFKTAVEYSADGIDWYANFVGSTSTITTSSVLTQTFASTSLDGAPIAANNQCTTVALTIPTPFQYVRVYTTITGANGSVWQQLVPIKEIQ